MTIQATDLGSLEVMLAHPGHVERIVREAAKVREHELASLADSLRGSSSGGPVGGYRIEKRTALIPVLGPLIPRGPVALSRYGLTSYEALRGELRRAGDDREVDSIVLMVDSPGGYVTGLHATADALLAARERKPVLTVVEGMAASAAYWLASQADAIILPPFGSVGSIGALVVHVEISRALDAAGVKVTILRAGARKAEGSVLEPLSEEARASLQTSVDDIRLSFATAVVGGRARTMLDLDAVMATEAAMFDARPAVEMGLADRIGTLDQVLDRLPGLAVAARRPVARSIAADMLAESGLGQTRIAVPAVAAPAPASPGSAGDVHAIRAEERARTAAIFAHPFAATAAGRILAEHLAASDKGTAAAIAELDRFAEFVRDNETEAARAAPPTLDTEMAVDAIPVIGHDGGIATDLSPMERGALAGARAVGKDPMAALAKLRGVAEAPQHAETADASAASSTLMGLGAESAELLRKLTLGRSR